MFSSTCLISSSSLSLWNPSASLIIISAVINPNKENVTVHTVKLRISSIWSILYGTLFKLGKKSYNYNY